MGDDKNLDLISALFGLALNPEYNPTINQLSCLLPHTDLEVIQQIVIAHNTGGKY